MRRNLLRSTDIDAPFAVACEAVHMLYLDAHGRAGAAWVWASAVTRR
jgi:hypothetical protein